MCVDKMFQLAFRIRRQLSSGFMEKYHGRAGEHGEIGSSQCGQHRDKGIRGAKWTVRGKAKNQEIVSRGAHENFTTVHTCKWIYLVGM